ncbi:MAG: hypothetical protein VYB54_07430 [Pseudomonadota bacterium]|nr:hypothetical protein [Pseudomonadota bacterium]
MTYTSPRTIIDQQHAAFSQGIAFTRAMAARGDKLAAFMVENGDRVYAVARDIKVDHLKAPIGGHGFRSGIWIVTHQGVEHRVDVSVPHQLPLVDQAARVMLEAARQIVRAEVAA